MRPGEHPLRELAKATAGVDRDRRVLLAVDQFEETFTACRDGRERAAFVAELVAERSFADRGAGDPRRPLRALRRVPGALAACSPPTTCSSVRCAATSCAVRSSGPRCGSGCVSSPELTDALVADVAGEPGALPMLSTALLELWQRRDGRRLRLATYQDTGGVQGAVARHAEDAFARLDRRQQESRAACCCGWPPRAPTARRAPPVALAELDDDEESPAPSAC